MIGRDPIRARLALQNHPFGAHTELGFKRCVSVVQFSIATAIPLSIPFGALSRHCTPPTMPKNMGLGIVEPKRQEAAGNAGSCNCASASRRPDGDDRQGKG